MYLITYLQAPLVLDSFMSEPTLSDRDQLCLQMMTLQQNLPRGFLFSFSSRALRETPNFGVREGT